MNKILATLCAALFCIAISSCGGSGNSNGNSSTSVSKSGSSSQSSNNYDELCENAMEASLAKQYGESTNILAELQSNVSELNGEQASVACMATRVILLDWDMYDSWEVYRYMYCQFYEQAATDPDALAQMEEASDIDLTEIYNNYQKLLNGDDASDDDDASEGGYYDEDGNYQVTEVAPGE